MNNISTEISQRKELGILDQKQVDQDDQQFEKVLQSAERHKLRVQHLSIRMAGRISKKGP